MTDDEPLRATEAARRLGITTKELLTLAYERRIEYVMRDGIVHFPPDGLTRYETAEAS
jgi:hypothetical protein